MDDAVIRSMLKWPDVPAAYGWLALDRRGDWRIRTAPDRFETIANPSLREFIGRNYLADDRGRWYFQNGPQRVFVSLRYAPLVFRLEGDGLVDHCGRATHEIKSAWLDEEGSLVLQATGAAGVLDDRDLGFFADRLEDGFFVLDRVVLPVGNVASSDLEARFGFVRDPRA